MNTTTGTAVGTDNGVAMTETPFWRAVLSDENGVPDEANVALFFILIVLSAGAFMMAFKLPFPLELLGGIFVTLLNLYKAMRGDFRAKQP